MNIFQSAITIYSYDTYRTLMENLVANGKTSGKDQSAALIEYTKLNLQRMNRWEKTFSVSESFKAEIGHTMKQTWWLITEAWCGDSAQILTVLARIVSASNGKIGLNIILRDENPVIMERYLTNGSRSVPKLIAVDENGNELFTWGPRPKTAQQMVSDWKNNPAGKSYEDLKKDLHLWYAKNKGEEVQQEIIVQLNMLAPAIV